MLKNLFSGAFLTFSVALLCSCSRGSDLPNQLTPEEQKEGWELLFDGQSLSGWHLYNEGNKPSAWKVENGELMYRSDSARVEHEDLVTDKEFENYDFRFEWKISEEGNSGVFINVVERKDIPTAWASGPEYQLLDSLHPDYAVNLKKRAGCLYGFTEQKNPVPARPAGEWNQGRIVQQNGKVQFYLNGLLTAEQDMTGESWKEMIAASSFNYFPDFGKATKGRIGLQKWYKSVAFRNLKIKENKGA
ncbi:DUF1080 domain-containing protein [Leadbetterella sp. DM7]|uniref:3-keto-disaccharide hydrolase n=1 Tax=Leadbetterella sp. DM7 TaxID=3235085 RepID=UPI00349E8164